MKTAPAEDYRAEYSNMQGRRQVQQATIAANVQVAGAFGTYREVAGASSERTDLLNRQIQSEQRWKDLWDKRIISEQEYNEHLTRLTGLMADRATAILDIGKAFYAGQQQVSGARAGIASTQSATTGLVQGSSALAVSQGLASTTQKRATIDSIDQQIAFYKSQGLAEDNPAMLEAKQARASAELDIQGSFSQAYRPSYEARARDRQLDLYGDAISKTFAVQGDVRGLQYARINQSQVKLGEIERKYNQETQAAHAETDPERRNALEKIARENYEVARNQEGSNLFSAQQNLEQNWTERLYSQTYGASSNFGMIANRFTHRESALTAGVYQRYFGGTQAQTAQMRHQAPMFYNSMMAGQTPEGLMNQGLSAAERAEGQRVMLEGGLKIDITVKDPQGGMIGKQSQQAQIGNNIRQVNPAPATFVVQG